MDWLDDALCRGKHADLWFPPLFVEDRTAPESHYDELAKMVCDHCPVRTQCAKIGQDEEMGTWGGWSRRDRLNGERTLSKKTISEHYVSMVPEHTTDIRLDIPALELSLKGFVNSR